MTGSWLIVKWIGIAILGCYLVLLVVALWRFRGKLPRNSFVPIMISNFVALSIPSIFESAVLTRVCFVLAHTVCIIGIAVLTRQLMRKNREGLLRADS
jgi:hypothetical protein